MPARTRPRIPRPPLARVAVLLACLGALASASAHSHLSASTPADGDTVVTAPSSVELDFTEPVQVAYSTFEALPLPVPYQAGETAQALDKRVHDLADQLSDQALAKKVAPKLRVDVGASPAKGTTDTVTLGLQQDLQPGYYVVVWRVLSEDGHVTHGVVVFRFQPNA